MSEDFDRAQTLILRRFRRLVRDAEKAGLVLVADADAMAVRFIREEEYRDADDIRELGEAIDVGGGCGGAHYTASGSAVGSG